MAFIIVAKQFLYQLRMHSRIELRML